MRLADLQRCCELGQGQSGIVSQPYVIDQILFGQTIPCDMMTSAHKIPVIPTPLPIVTIINGFKNCKMYAKCKLENHFLKWYNGRMKRLVLEEELVEL